MKEKFNQEYYDRYVNGETLWDISETENKTYKQVFEMVFNHRFEYRLLPDSEKDYICENYLKGASCIVLAKRYGVDHHVILNVLEDCGIKRDYTLSARKYSVDEHYFDTIDTPEKAYILGLLYADGCNYNRKGKWCINISLQEGDKELLENVRKELKYEKPLEYIDYSNKRDFGHTCKNQYGLFVFSKHMCNELHKKGMVRNKSLILEFPEWLNPDLYSHFIRGYFDGDGSIMQYGKYKIVKVSIVSTNNFCERIKEICANIGIDTRIYESGCNNGATKQLNIFRQIDVKKFLDWIYTDATIYLKRKYQKYLEYYNMDNSLSA